jgi:hypothetical protein
MHILTTILIAHCATILMTFDDEPRLMSSAVKLPTILNRPMTIVEIICMVIFWNRCTFCEPNLKTEI